MKRLKIMVSMVFWVGIVWFLYICHSIRNNRLHKMETTPLPAIEWDDHAVGRFLIGLPKGAAFGRWYQRYCGTGRISVIPEITTEQFNTIVTERASALGAIRHFEGGSQLVNTKVLNIAHGIALIYWRNDYFKGRFLKSDDYALLNNIMYKFESDTEIDPNEQEEHLQFLEKVFRHIRPLRPGEIPTEHGFCFEDSILVDQPRPQIFETVIAHGVWLDRPDVRFSFTTFCNGETLDPPLLERLGRSSRRYSGTRVLRSRQRNLTSGEVGEEHLERVRESNGTEGHLFIWEAQGLPDDQYEHPQIRLDMSTGVGQKGAVNASLSDEDALRLWDAILDSIRLRPVRPSR